MNQGHGKFINMRWEIGRWSNVNKTSLNYLFGSFVSFNELLEDEEHGE